MAVEWEKWLQANRVKINQAYREKMKRAGWTRAPWLRYIVTTL